MPGGGVSVRDVDVSSLYLPTTDGGVEPRAHWNETGVEPGLLAKRQLRENGENRDNGSDGRAERVLMIGMAINRRRNSSLHTPLS